ncbi:small basic protein [Erythromicrobium ramosum]|uniref:Small basic protein n=1 Tax=Erythrobacter ramosus TaxID=35811 RepID=A0A6I4UHW4_9SPHN|nr:hypothetical protein [Erythrobacter ramosus]MBB3776421.1 small basic protein [Erythrobacter ramosus]MXP38500.1 hypothetical protein [Erythrobacter ramosus]
MFRRDFAMKISLAHFAGLIGLAIAATVMSADPNADEAIGVFVIGLFMSAFLFLPILAVTLVFVGDVLRHRLAFVLLGPVAVTLLVSAVLGLDAGKVIALQTALSSLVLYLLIRDYEVPDCEAA